jgi:hypothetical protein
MTFPFSFTMLDDRVIPDSSIRKRICVVGTFPDAIVAPRMTKDLKLASYASSAAERIAGVE